MAAEQVLRIYVDRHVINTERSFDAVLDHVYRAVSDLAQGLLLFEPVIDYQAEPGRLMRIAVGAPDLIDELTRAGPNAAMNVPGVILIQQTVGGGARLAYDTIASLISRYESERAVRIAQRLDDKVLGLIRRAAGS